MTDEQVLEKIIAAMPAIRPWLDQEGIDGAGFVTVYDIITIARAMLTEGRKQMRDEAVAVCRGIENGRYPDGFIAVGLAAECEEAVAEIPLEPR